MKLYIGIDPGVHTNAYAVVTEDFVLQDIGFVPSDPKSVSFLLSKFRSINTTLVVEIPDKIEKGVRALDIINLVRSAERPVTLAAHLPFERVLDPGVFMWKGNAPKDATKNRVLGKIKDPLKLIEKIAKTKQNHVYDAIGLAIWGMKKGSN